MKIIFNNPEIGEQLKIYEELENMPKTQFSKSELKELHQIFIKEKMFPLLDIKIYYQPFDSGVNHNLYRITFCNENKQGSVSFVTRTESKIDLLRKQLIDYFITSKKK